MAQITAPVSLAAAALDTAIIEQNTGLKGTLNKEENVFKVNKPRDDIKISCRRLDHASVHGARLLGRFHASARRQTMMMGDTVLFEDEVNPVMSAALDNGLEVTALHNHFFFDEPKVYFMHIGGMGDAGTLADRGEEGLRQDC